MYHVYILYSIKWRKYYTGSTGDLQRRIIEHNSGQTRSTRNGRPWVLIQSFELDEKKSALKLESNIKKRGVQRFLKDME